MYNSKKMATKINIFLLTILGFLIIFTGCGPINIEEGNVSESIVETTTFEETTSTIVTTTTSTTKITTTSVTSTTSASTSDSTTTSVETVVNEITKNFANNSETEIVTTTVETSTTEPSFTDSKEEMFSLEVNYVTDPLIEISFVEEVSTETIIEEELVFETTTEEQLTEIIEETTTSTDVIELKSVEEIAEEVIQGLWGNGSDRKNRLMNSGYDYDTIQEKVNEILNYNEPYDEIEDNENIYDEYEENVSENMTYVKQFTRGTYYAYGTSCYGGSGRYLIDCSYGEGDVKGSIASSYLYNNYGYNYNGKRTKVYLEIEGYSDMNGYYYLDDSDAGNSEVIDFFYIYGGNCQFQNQGVVNVNCYIVSY